MNKYHKLYVVATPIGNLEEISDLAKKILSKIKLIICEDTRVTQKLLNLLNLNFNQKLISFNKINETEKTQKILQLLEKQECVLVSDAGYPVISDPGFDLIKTLRKLNAPIQIVNGPCALIHALVASGIDSRKFFFANFLTKKKIQRKIELNQLKPILNISTIVYYEPLNYLITGLNILLDVFGDIVIGVGRELSKIHETFYYDKISNLISQIELKGEFVIIIPKQDILDVCLSDQEIVIKVDQLLKSNINLKSACKLLATSKQSASLIYKTYIFKKKSKDKKLIS
ncbi:16S rRNA (cytidine(1402)-2'-O)-methyltransferase [[Mycoplasma] cavipharyngis]|uniref:16S rRNA (cytidine(1402)-2'-O)-methyltransferase n=1 Tax=[Mycoplasma] cavipharyngis TaxID=92757 RepID=UPI003703E20F